MPWKGSRPLATAGSGASIAEIVGRGGKAIGIDVDEAALEKAKIRADQLKLRNVEFIPGDVRTAILPGPFDAAGGRLVLLYVADPVAALARIATQVGRGGIVAFQ